MHCETTDDESETKIMLLINKLQIENKQKTQIDSNYYQNNVSISNLEKRNKSQNETVYTPQIIKNSSKMNNIKYKKKF